LSIVVNSTPLISLAVLNQLGLLTEIFGNVIVPLSVYNEVVINGKGKNGYDKLSETNWFDVAEVKNTGQKQSIMIELDEGESEVITIAKEKGIKTVCIDEFAGRRYAKLLGLEVIGTLGILLIAKQKGYVPELRSLFRRLLENDRHIGKALCNKILLRVEEAEI